MANDRTRTVAQLGKKEDGSYGTVDQAYNFVSWPAELGAKVGTGFSTGIRYPHICAFFINENIKDRSEGANMSRGGTTSSVLGTNNVDSTTNNIVTNRISNSGFSNTTKGLTSGALDATGKAIGSGAANLSNSVVNAPNVVAAYGYSTPVDAQRMGDNLGSAMKQLIAPTYKRLNLAIFLPMPMEVKHEYGVVYNEAAMEGMFGTALTALNNEGFVSAVEHGTEAGVRGVMSKLTEAGASFLNMGESGKHIFNKTLGTVENQRTEQVFEKVQVREFTFRWQFWPKTEAESEELKTILELFKENMLPAFRSDDNVGGFYTMPNEFDIEFYTSEVDYDTTNDTFTERFKENAHIPRISTCVLTSMLIDSTPKGQFAAFRGTSAPVTTAVTMTFKELSPLHRGMVGKGVKIGRTRAGGH